MYRCYPDKVCNTVREPVCDRPCGPTAESVTGTGPGSACREPPEHHHPPPPPRLPGCVVRYRGGGNITSLQGIRTAYRGC